MLNFILSGISAKKLESWLEEQDEELSELREELKKERKQHENTLRVASASSYLLTKMYAAKETLEFIYKINIPRNITWINKTVMKCLCFNSQI